MKRNQKLIKIESIGFYITMSIVSIIIGFGILGLIAKLVIKIIN